MKFGKRKGQEDLKKKPGSSINLKSMMMTPPKEGLSEAAKFFFDTKPEDVVERQREFQAQCPHGKMKLSSLLKSEEREVYYYACNSCGAIIPKRYKLGVMA